MRRLCLPLMLCAVFLSVVSTPAHATYSWDWIDHLSGPGPFRGSVLDWRLVCLKEGKPVKIAIVGGIVGSACSYEKGEQRRASIDLNFGFLHAKGDARFADGKEIKLTTLEPTFSWRIWGPFEAGAGVGVYWFSAETFPSVSRVMLEPIRFDVRPLRLNFNNPTKEFENEKNNWWQEILTLRAGWVVIPRGFEPNDFHAVSDAARRIPSEAVKTWGVFLDGEPIIRRIRCQWSKDDCKS